MTKYRFQIKTRDGFEVNNLSILGRDQADAERKLNQMYLHCQIVMCVAVSGQSRLANEDFCAAFAQV
ncbi:MAG: hypothetical protein M0037_00340 [Betaproteobacteria bacterium]|nr:hypothetical protein [Betaproteobacteria bacterium]